MNQFSATKEYRIGTTWGDLKMPSMHYHASYELYYLEAGNREYFVEDRVFSVSAGTFVLIPPGKLHKTGGDYGLRTLVVFSDAFLGRNFSPIAVEGLLKCFDHLQIIPPESRQPEFKGMLKKLEESNSELEFAVYLSVLLTELSKCTAEETCDEYMSGIVEYINSHYAQITAINQIAEHFFLSKYHLCRVFKNAMGITLIDYLNQVRVKNACGLLSSTDQSIQKIAVLCGFRSGTYFSNLFKKHTGLSPREYRQNNEKKQ